tara:strand:+ start:30 stop:686 length:657 start_codon:yes stop_codon:yes gene_type:complete
MIIDKSSQKWILDNMYNKSYLKRYGQYPVGVRFHLGIIDNHKEMKEAYESDDEYYQDKLVGAKISTKELRDVSKTGAYCYENNESYDFENCTPARMKSLKNDHFEYLRTDTFWSKRGLTAFSFKKHTYIPEKNHSKVLFWNWVYQEFVLKHRVKTERPTSTINQDDDIQSYTLFHEGLNRELIIVTSTKDKYRNHTESLKDAKIFVEPGDNQFKVLYK